MQKKNTTENNSLGGFPMENESQISLLNAYSLKSISFKKGAKKSCVHEICRLLPRSKSSTNHNKTSPNPNLRKYTVKGFVMYIFLSNCFTWFHRNL